MIGMNDFDGENHFMNEQRTFTRRDWMIALGSGLVYASCAKTGSRQFYVLPTDRDTYVFYDIKDPPTLDPARSWGFFDGRLIGLVFSNLVRFSRKAEIEPDLAREWTVSDDGTQYTFRLNPKACFSNGRPVTAEDIRYSFERVLNPETASPSRWMLERIASIEIPAPDAVRLTLNEPFVPFLGLLAMPAASIVPREVVERGEREGIPFGEHPIGSGPWRFEEWRHDQYLSFVRNETYWGNKPKLRQLIAKVISNEFTAIAEFETGNCAVINPVPIAEINRWRTHPQWKPFTQLAPMLNTDMILLNCERPPFDREEVRRALRDAVETPLVLECVREGAGSVSTGPIPPGLDGHTPGKQPVTRPPETIRPILQQAGLDERGVDLILPATEDFTRTTGEVIQALWKRAGVPIRLRQLEWVTYRRALREGKFDAAYRGWFADYPDGDSFIYPLFHSSQIGSGNMSRFRDETTDTLIERSQRELNPQHRSRLLTLANDSIYDKVPAIFLWHQAKYIVTQPWLKDFSEPSIFNGTKYLTERIEIPQTEGLGSRV